MEAQTNDHQWWNEFSFVAEQTVIYVSISSSLFYLFFEEPHFSWCFDWLNENTKKKTWINK